MPELNRDPSVWPRLFGAAGGWLWGGYHQRHIYIMSAAAAPLLAAACAFPASLLTGSWVPNAYMDCGDAPLCGVLTLETGLGPGNYHHNKTGVHGLWPEVGQYGTSQCIGPTRSTEDPTKVYTCYNEPDTPTAHTISFEQHEWEKHGQCAGVADVEDFFGQVCSLADKPVSLMEAARKSGHVDLQGYADLLQVLSRFFLLFSRLLICLAHTP